MSLRMLSQEAGVVKLIVVPMVLAPKHGDRGS